MHDLDTTHHDSLTLFENALHEALESEFSRTDEPNEESDEEGGNE
jgi:hypothetical protein